MIEKIPDKKNGWSFANLTNEEWKSVANYILKNEGLHCVIVNDKTSKMFRMDIGRKNIVTVNNKVPDGELYFNKYC